MALLRRLSNKTELCRKVRAIDAQEPQDLSPPEVIWQPDPDRVERSTMTAFRRFAAQGHGRQFADYNELWRWSTAQPEAFWSEVAGFFEVAFPDPPTTVLPDRVMPGARWFPGATLNYAEHALRHGPGKAEDDPAVLIRREDGRSERLSYGQLRTQVAAVRAGLADLGVGVGDRVVALLPNSTHAVVAFLATASLGAIWSSCSPDFGIQAVAERFTQIEPSVLIAVDGYRYNGRPFDIRPTVASLQDRLPGLRATVLVPYLQDPAHFDRSANASSSGDLTRNQTVHRSW